MGNRVRLEFPQQGPPRGVRGASAGCPPAGHKPGAGLEGSSEEGVKNFLREPALPPCVPTHILPEITSFQAETMNRLYCLQFTYLICTSNCSEDIR